MHKVKVPFNRPHVTGRELGYIREAIANHQLSGDGPFTRRCEAALESMTGCHRVLLTHSCTAALEMAAILTGLGPGDEVLMPSFTFVSTANAVVLRGATPVFVDIRGDTLNIDEQQIEAAITPKTKAIFVVHYAGVACEMDTILQIAREHHLMVIEDSAQGLLSAYRGRPLGTMGQLGAVSFHETKNVIAGEGGALLINDPALVTRAEIIREKGTNRSQFFRGQVDKYTWMDIGSSFIPGEVGAAFLLAQLEHAREITDERLKLWQEYHKAYDALESAGILRRPIVPGHCEHNAHLYYILLSDLETRSHFIDTLNQCGVNAVFHYVPLHSSPAGRKYGRAHGSLRVTETQSERLVRMPMWLGLESTISYAIEQTRLALLR